MLRLRAIIGGVAVGIEVYLLHLIRQGASVPMLISLGAGVLFGVGVVIPLLDAVLYRHPAPGDGDTEVT